MTPQKINALKFYEAPPQELNPQQLELEDDKNCPICLGLMVEPVLLDCKHRFCNHCMKRFLNKSNHINAIQNFKKNCPLCRQGIKVKKMEIDYKFQNLIKNNFE